MSTTETAKKYKWAHPAEWLDSLIQTRINANDHEGVAELLKAITNSGKLDSDDIQDIFQSEMSEDGYFKPIREEVPALFEVYPHTATEAPEASGVVYHFCSEVHREAFKGNLDVETAEGVSRDFIEGTVCDECGEAL